METKRVKDIMVPLSEYATVPEDGTLRDAVAALKKSHANFDQAKYRHRAVLVCNQNNVVVGKVSLISILRALEPKYEEMLSDRGPLHMGFTRKFQKAMFESLKLWQDPMDQVCRKAAEIKVKNFMTIPDDNEIIAPDQGLGEAIHQLVIGHHQSLLVSEGGKIVGVLRLTDTFEAVAENILACSQ
jgi:predicted transcriptional regulator